MIYFTNILSSKCGTGIALCAALWCVLPGGACAEKRAPARARVDKHAQKIEGLLGRAREALSQKDHAQALLLFQQAYDLSQDPELQYHMARCHQAMGNAGRAAFSYRQYLKYGVNIEKRQDVEDLAMRMELLAQATREGSLTPGVEPMIPAEEPPAPPKQPPARRPPPEPPAAQRADRKG